MNSVKKISAMTMLCGALSLPAAAQSSGSTFSNTLADTWYVAPSAGVVLPDSMFDAGQRGQAYGLALGKPVSKDWDIQLLVKYGRSDSGNVTYKQNTLGLDALYMFNREQFHPFLLLGAGYQRDRLNSGSGEISDRSPYIDAGVGIHYAVDKRWAMQVDFRRELGFLKNSDFSGDHNRNNYVSLNFNYSFN